MIFSKLFNHKNSGVAIILIANAFLTNIYPYSSLATANNRTTSTEFVRRNTEQLSWWQRILRRNGGGGSRRGDRVDLDQGSVCVVLPEEYNLFMWNETPRFVVFSDRPNLQVQIVTSFFNGSVVKWEDEIENLRADYKEPHIVSYDSSIEKLNAGEIYFFEIYSSGTRRDKIPFKIIEKHRSQIDDELIKIDAALSNSLLTEDEYIQERIKYFANITYKEDLGITASEEEGLLFDIINEVLNINSLQEKEAYIDVLYEEYCELKTTKDYQQL